MQKINIYLKPFTSIIVISTQLLILSCSHIADEKSMVLERSQDSNSENKTEKKKRQRSRIFGNSNRDSDNTSRKSNAPSIRFMQERGTESDLSENENDNSIGCCEKFIKYCCFCFVLKVDENAEEEQEEEESRGLIGIEKGPDNDESNPIEALVTCAKSGVKTAHFMGGGENYKISISSQKKRPLEEECKFWQNRIGVNGRKLYPTISPLRREPFSSSTDNRLLSFIEPLTCKKLLLFLESEKEHLTGIKNKPKGKGKGKEKEEDMEENGIIAGIKKFFSFDEKKEAPNLTIEELNASELISDGRDSAENRLYRDNNSLIFFNELNYDIVDNALKNEKGHYTLSLTFKKGIFLAKGCSPPTLLEAIKILQQDSLLSEPRLIDKILYTTSQYNTGKSSSVIAVKYDSKNMRYEFSLTNPKGTDKNITILSVQKIEDNPSEKICCDECTSPIFCFGQSCIRPKYLCYICYSPAVYQCGKIKLKGLNCSIPNCACCYCPTLPCCIYPTSTTCIDRCGCLCCSACCCCLINSSTPLMERCGYYCCLCNPVCSCGV